MKSNAVAKLIATPKATTMISVLRL